MSPPAFTRVLIIDDTALLRGLLVEAVQMSPGHPVVADCATLADAIEACRRHRPDLVILDWCLPDGSGDALMRAITPELSETRWLVLSSRQNGRIVQTAIALGAHGFVMKQSDLATFREALARLAGGGIFYCPISSRVLLDALRSRPTGDGLTERELEVLRHFAAGTNPKSIAAQLKISTKTVQNQLCAIRQKLGIQETAGLVRYAIHIGLA